MNNEKELKNSLEEKTKEKSKPKKDNLISTSNKIESELFAKMRVIACNHRVKKDDLVDAIFKRYIKKYENSKGPIPPRPAVPISASEIID